MRPDVAMHKAVLDTTVLVSAFLKPVPEGAAFRLLGLAGDDAFELYCRTTSSRRRQTCC